MQFSALSLTALFASSVIAQQGVVTHVVRVGSVSGDLTFMPSTLAAAPGDMVQFQFAPKNHSVVQSTFDQPCQPSRLHSNITGLFSGYMPVAANAQMTATWTIKVADAKPLWLYCSQGKHCQNGMVMVVNPPAANKSRTFETYKALAAKSPVNLGGDGLPASAPGGNTTVPSPSTPSSPSSPGNNNGGGNGGNIGGGSGSGNGGSGSTPTDGSSPTPTGVTLPGNTGAASSLKVAVSAALGGVAALGFAVLL